MFNKIFAYIERQNITLGSWIAAFLGIFFVRTFIENFSTYSDSRIVTSDIYSLIHYYLSYFVIATSMLIIVKMITNAKVVNIAKILLSPPTKYKSRRVRPGFSPCHLRWRDAEENWANLGGFPPRPPMCPKISDTPK